MGGVLALMNVMRAIVMERVAFLFAAENAHVVRLEEEKRRDVFNSFENFLNLAKTKAWDTHMLSVEEVANALTVPETYNKLDMYGFPVDEPAYYFKVLEVDYEAGEKCSVLDYIRCATRGNGPMLQKDLYAAHISLQKLKEELRVFDEESLQFEKKLSKLTVMARSLVEHGEHIFMNMQEYRARHPNFKKQFKPPISEAKLNRAPWENEDEYWMSLLGSWFESEEAVNDASNEPPSPPTDLQLPSSPPPQPPMPPLRLPLPPEPPAPLALMDEEDDRIDGLRHALDPAEALRQRSIVIHEQSSFAGNRRPKRPVSAPSFASERAIQAVQGQLRPNRPV